MATMSTMSTMPVSGRMGLYIMVGVLFCSLKVQASCVTNTPPTTQDGVYLDGQLYLKTSEATTSDCATTCLLHTYCLSFGFDSKSHSCHLHFMDSSSRSLTTRSGWVHVDISGWQEVVLGPCTGHTCTQGEKCHVNRVTKHPVCISVSAECPALPTLPNSQLAPGPRVDGSVRTYTCDANYYDVIHDTSDASTTCMINGTWSTVGLICDGPFIRLDTPSRNTLDVDVIPDDVLMNITGNTSSLVFYIMACADSYTVFTTTGDANGQYQDLNVIIGGWGNSRVVILDAAGQELGDFYTPSILRCDQYLPFWVDWTDGVIRVGSGTEIGNNVMVSWSFPGSMELLNIAIGSHYNIYVKRLFYVR